jgi:hypothetical protein
MLNDFNFYMTQHNVSFNIDCDFVWFRLNWIYCESSKFLWLIWERRIVFQHSMLFYKLDITKNDVICMQMTLFDISMNVFNCESVETNWIDEKLRSKNNVRQSNVDRIMRFLDNNMNCVISLDKINCFVDSQLILEVDETIELKFRWIVADMNVWRAVKDSTVQQLVRCRIDCEKTRTLQKTNKKNFHFRCDSNFQICSILFSLFTVFAFRLNMRLMMNLISLIVSTILILIMWTIDESDFQSDFLMLSRI